MAREEVLSPEDTELEIIRPRGCGKLFNYLMDYKLKSSIEEMGISLKDKFVLDVCCGSGIDAEYLARGGAKVVILDYDAGGIKRTLERARRFGFKVYPVIGDTRNLPFKKGAFNLSFVNDGLHHLSDPHQGVKELCRVGRDFVVVMEPAYSLLTRLAVKVGLSVNYEEDDGNYVYRFRENELRDCVLRNGFKEYKGNRYLLWHPHMPPKWFYIFDKGFLFYFFLFFFKSINVFLGRLLGNKISFVAFNKK